MLRHQGSATVLIFFAFFTFLRVFSHGLPPIEASLEEQIQRGGSLYEDIGPWAESVADSGLLAELQGSRVMVPPRGFAWITPVLGIGTTQTWKRFNQPSHEWLHAMWQFCDPDFAVTSVDQVRTLSRQHPALPDEVQACYKMLEAEQIMTLGKNNGADFAVIYLPNQNEPPTSLIGDPTWGLIRVK